MNRIIDIYTDGSCDHNYKIGGWASVLLYEDKEIIIHGDEENTTHNRMELISVINSIMYILKNNIRYKIINIYTDSQYVEKLYSRQDRLKKNNYFTKKGLPIRNKDLVCKLLDYINSLEINFVKVKAHQKKSDNNYNRIVDKLSRKIVRKIVKKLKNNE